MINNNGNLVENNQIITIDNRGYNYGDALFETIKVIQGKLLFWEDHYFRLMASMRIMRMEIPMNFTMEYLEDQVLKTLDSSNLSKVSARVKLIVHRNSKGLYLPTTNAIKYLISVKEIDNPIYKLNESNYEVDLFKDYYISPDLLSTLKSNNKLLHVVGSIYAKENGLDNCIILNTNKNVVEALNGNIFLVSKNKIKTPPLGDGCLKGIMRKQIMGILELMPDYDVEEMSISPFELQRADEIFITNVIQGIQPVSKYRKKEFNSDTSHTLIEKLNNKVNPLIN